MVALEELKAAVQKLMISQVNTVESASQCKLIVENFKLLVLASVASTRGKYLYDKNSNKEIDIEKIIERIIKEHDSTQKIPYTSFIGVINTVETLEIFKILEKHNMLLQPELYVNELENPIILAAKTQNHQLIGYLFNKREQEPWKTYWQQAGNVSNDLVKYLVSRSLHDNNIAAMVNYVCKIPSIVTNLQENIFGKDDVSKEFKKNLCLSEDGDRFTTVRKSLFNLIKFKSNKSPNAATSDAHRDDFFQFIIVKIKENQQYLNQLKQPYYNNSNSDLDVNNSIIADIRLVMLKYYLEHEPLTNENGDHDTWQQLVKLCNAEEYLSKYKSSSKNCSFQDFKQFALQNEQIISAINFPRIPGNQENIQELPEISKLLINQVLANDSNKRENNYSMFSGWDVDISGQLANEANLVTTGVDISELKQLNSVYECAGLLLTQVEPLIENITNPNDILQLVKVMEFDSAIKLINKLYKIEHENTSFDLDELKQEAKKCILEQQDILQNSFMSALKEIRSTSSCIIGRITRVGQGVIYMNPNFRENSEESTIKKYFEDKLQKFAEKTVVEILLTKLQRKLPSRNGSIAERAIGLFYGSIHSSSIKEKNTDNVTLAIQEILSNQPASITALQNKVASFDRKTSEILKSIMFDNTKDKFSIEDQIDINNFLNAMFSINDTTVLTLPSEGKVPKASCNNISADNLKNTDYIKLVELDKPPYNRTELLKKCYGANNSSDLIQQVAKDVGMRAIYDPRIKDLIIKCATVGTSEAAIKNIYNSITRNLTNLSKDPINNAIDECKMLDKKLTQSSHTSINTNNVDSSSPANKSRFSPGIRGVLWGSYVSKKSSSVGIDAPAENSQSILERVSLLSSYPELIAEKIVNLCPKSLYTESASSREFIFQDLKGSLKNIITVIFASPEMRREFMFNLETVYSVEDFLAKIDLCLKNRTDKTSWLNIPNDFNASVKMNAVQKMQVERIKNLCGLAKENKINEFNDVYKNYSNLTQARSSGNANSKALNNGDLAASASSNDVSIIRRNDYQNKLR